MRHLVTLAISLFVTACGSGVGDSNYQGERGGAPAFGNGQNGGSTAFGSNAGSSPAFGDGQGGASSFGTNPTPPSGPDPTRACSTNADCAGGAQCTADRGEVGFCIAFCETVACPGGLSCVAVKTDSESDKLLHFCLRPCGSKSDCPTLTGLESQCTPISSSATSPKYCVWDVPKDAPATPADAG